MGIATTCPMCNHGPWKGMFCHDCGARLYPPGIDEKSEKLIRESVDWHPQAAIGDPRFSRCHDESD